MCLCIFNSIKCNISIENKEMVLLVLVPSCCVKHLFHSSLNFDGEKIKLKSSFRLRLHLH